METESKQLPTKIESNQTEINKQEEVSPESLTIFQNKMITVYFEKHLESNKGIFNNEAEKSLLISNVAKEMGLTLPQTELLYKRAKDNFYQSIKRLPAEVIINQINAEGQILKEEVYNTSTKDITAKSHEIMDINDKLAKINKLYDIAPQTNIYFKQDIDVNDLLNPDNFKEKPNE